MNENLVKIIKEISEELNIKCQMLSDNWIASLTKDDKQHYIVGFKFDLNSQATGQLCDDKYALYTVLKANNMPIIEHKILFNEETMKLYLNNDSTKDIAYQYFKDHNQDVVLKANIGTCGTQVFHVTTPDYLDKTLNKLFINNNTISICPFYHIKHEYRLIYLDGQCELIYGKIKPIVMGDGKSALLELFRSFNPHYFNNNNISPCPNYEWDYIPKLNEIIEYNWKFNLSKGASAFSDIDSDLKKKLTDLGIQTAQLINLRFGSIDIIECENNELLVLEINSGVMMENVAYIIPDGQNIVYNIYKKAITLMFNE